MSLADTIARVRSGVFKIAFFNESGQKIGGGSAFLCNRHLITNNHVFGGYQTSALVGLRQESGPKDHYIPIDPKVFASRLVTGSQENSYDYAVLHIPEIVDAGHDFILEPPGERRVGDEIALLGFPLEHDNLTCHSGVISSFYLSGVAKVIQLDASVNAGNSGCPLIDPNTGVVIGMVTRRATGLSQLFNELRKAIDHNITYIREQTAGFGIRVGGFDPLEGMVVSQRQMMLTLNEIERQANVGVGYAFSSEHLLEESCLQRP